MPLAEMVIPITLGDKDYTLRFSANTMVHYEELTGKFFMDTVASLYEVVFPKGHVDAEGNPVAARVSGLGIVRRISMVELRALLCASIHDYDAKGDPVWPLTLSQVGRLLDFQNIPGVFVKFLTGVSSNSPSKDELGESPAVPRATAAAAGSGSADPSIPGSGGGAGIELPAGALD